MNALANGHRGFNLDLDDLVNDQNTEDDQECKALTSFEIFINDRVNAVFVWHQSTGWHGEQP